MSKNYQIIDPNISYNDTNKCTIFYLMYIVLFFVIIFIIYKIVFSYYLSTEEFNNGIEFNNGTNQGSEKLPNENVENAENVENLQNKNNELQNIKDTLENKLLEQTKAIYLSKNFDYIDPDTFNNQLTFLLADFADTKLPEIEMSEKNIINTQSDLNDLLSRTSNMKNFYKPGEIVELNSTLEIGKNEICYRKNNIPYKPTSEFLEKYPACMVCEIENSNDISNTNIKNLNDTKTNISKVCLFNPEAKPNSGIPNLAQCKNFCNIEKNK